MRKSTMAAFIFITFTIFALILKDTVFAWPVPDTEQTKCYAEYWEEITCPLPGHQFYGQDAQYIINPQSYTKLDANGNNLPDTATSWVMVRDNVTNLIWEVKTPRDFSRNYNNPHDSDNTYTWYDGVTGTPGDGTDTLDCINAINSENFGGYDDWRLPTPKEISSIIKATYPGYPIDRTYFPNSVMDWSSAICAFDTSKAWELYGDDLIPRSKSLGNQVRAVRGEQSTNDFIDNGDGTVSDISTGLMWQQDTPGTSRWKSALAYCEGLSLAGYDDWRLPTPKELYSIVNTNTYNPSIDTTYFPNTLPFHYWTSTTSPKPTGNDGTFIVNFYSGFLGNYYKTASYVYVRAVRNTDIDSDNDGIPDDGNNSGSPSDNPCIGGATENCDDNCIDTPNSDQADIDSDGIGDVCDNCPNDPDNDIDNDTYCGDIDNCPNHSNPDQRNSDFQNGGDVCDICPNDPLDECDPNGSGGCSIGIEGDTCSSQDGSVTIIVPAGAVDTDTTFSFTDNGSGFELETNRGKVKTAIGVNTQPAGVIFNVPVTIILRWDDVDPNDGRIDGTNMKENKLYIAKDGVIITSTCDIDSCSCIDPPALCVEDPIENIGCECDLEKIPPPPPPLPADDGDYFKIHVTSFSDYVLVAPLDTDDDGVPNDFDGVVDNCPDVANPNQEDTDEDEIGDVCDTCTDKDGDEYGREGLDISGCPNPDEYDCNDLEYSINPGTTKNTTVTYNGDYVVMVDDYDTEPPTGDVDISTLLTDSVPQTISGWDVLFTIYDVNGESVEGPISITTDSSGTAYITIQDIPVGVYTIVTEFTGDNCYYYDSQDSAVLAVFDPTGGFATGGGWYMVENENPELSGKANFGFNVKYKQDASTGNLEFQFQAGDINLKSTSIDWLVMSETNAQFKGQAKINGTEGHFFRVIAKDLGEPGVGVDHFDIIIWDGDPDELDTTQVHRSNNELSGGNIVVHKK